jgi:hypothetical protein
MNSVFRYLKTLIVVLVLIAIGYGFFVFYPYIFAKVVVGKILKVERVQISIAMMQNNPVTKNDKLNSQLFSFAVSIQTPDGVVHTASAEDRQWAAVTEGLCVTAKFLPYPPWQLDRSGTYYGARLIESHICN